MNIKINAVATAAASFFTAVAAARQRAFRWVYRHTFSTRDRLTLYEDLAFLLDNRRTLEEALTDMRDCATDFGRKTAPAAVWLGDCLTDINNGQSLDRALADWVPRQEAALIGAGVRDRRIAQALRRASRLTKAIDEMKTTLLGALAEPAMLLSAVLGVMIFTSLMLLPKLAMASPRALWHGSLEWIAVSSDALAQHGILLGILAVSGIAWTTWSFARLTGPVRRLLDNVMPWSVYREVQGVVFLLNFASLLRAGVKTLDALDALSQHASPWLLERLNATRWHVRQGNHLGLALYNTGYHFPSRDAVNKLRLLTAGDAADDIIDNYAFAWLNTTLATLKRRAKTLSLLLTLMVYGYMMLLFSAVQQLQGMVGHHA